MENPETGSLPHVSERWIEIYLNWHQTLHKEAIETGHEVYVHPY